MRREESRAFLFLPGHLRSGICALRLALPFFLSVLPLPNVHLYTMTSNTRLRGLVDSGPRSFMPGPLACGDGQAGRGDAGCVGGASEARVYGYMDANTTSTRTRPAPPPMGIPRKDKERVGLVEPGLIWL